MMKVVIVDDVQLNVSLLKALVTRLPGTEPVCFTDPQQALDWSLANDPDLLIVDFMMPVLSGTELTQRFRERYPDTPVLMVTANHEMELRYDALNKGVTDFLNKPINSTELLARAKNMLALNRSHKHLAEEVRMATKQLLSQERETIFCLARAAEYRDPETGAHILRMAHYSKQIALHLGLPKNQQDLILQTAPMHDIGKVGIADMILLKPGRLTPEEFAVMKQHASIGYEILNANSSPLLKVAAEIAHTHHEKFDGSGYPRGLKGKDIALFGRIVAVADVFDALTSERPYKKAWSIDDASKLLREGAGAHFDPACVDAFPLSQNSCRPQKLRMIRKEGDPHAKKSLLHRIQRTGTAQSAGTRHPNTCCHCRRTQPIAGNAQELAQAVQQRHWLGGANQRPGWPVERRPAPECPD